VWRPDGLDEIVLVRRARARAVRGRGHRRARSAAGASRSSAHPAADQDDADRRDDRRGADHDVG
jgi:hypothetical protein